MFPFPGSSILGYQEVKHQRDEFGVRYIVKLKHSLQAEFGSNERLKQLLGFSNPLNFIPTIWEVIPWSWLIDYFLNVQQIIEAGVTATGNVQETIRSQRTRSKLKGHLTAVKPALVANQFPVNWITQSAHLGQYVSERTVFDRSLPGNIGLPIPTVSYPNSIRKLANASAALFARRAESHAVWVL